MAELEVKNAYIPTATQLKAHKAYQRFKLFGGAMGGGKSRWLCEEVKRLSMKYPGNRIVMARYHLADFKNSTLKTLLECIPEALISNHHRQDHTITLVTGSEIIYMGLSNQEDVEKLKSMELGAFAFDEASEIKKETFLMAQSRLRRKLPDGTSPPFFGLLATNPMDCWLKDDFVLNGGGENYVYIPSRPRDNPYLPKDYEDILRQTYPDNWVKAFLDGNWDQLTEGDIAIHPEWVRMAINREIEIEEKPVVSADIARFGDDEIVIQYGKGYRLIEQDITMKRSLMETVGRIINIRKKHNAKVLVIDDAALGGGVTDRLREQREKVMAINGGVKALHEEKFRNLKTEMWWNARELFKEGKVSIINDPILTRQLSGVKYLYSSNGKLMIEPKDKVKARLGRSPDRADALIQLLWGAKHMRDSSKDFMRRANYLEPTNRFNDYGWSYTDNYTGAIA